MAAKGQGTARTKRASGPGPDQSSRQRLERARIAALQAELRAAKKRLSEIESSATTQRRSVAPKRRSAGATNPARVSAVNAPAKPAKKRAAPAPVSSPSASASPSPRRAAPYRDASGRFAPAPPAPSPRGRRAAAPPAPPAPSPPARRAAPYRDASGRFAPATPAPSPRGRRAAAPPAPPAPSPPLRRAGPYRDASGRFAPAPLPPRRRRPSVPAPPAPPAPSAPPPRRRRAAAPSAPPAPPAPSAPPAPPPRRRRAAAPSAPRPSRPTRPVAIRDERGRFISAAEKARQDAIKKAERIFAEQNRLDEERRTNLYPVSGPLFLRLAKIIKQVSRAIEASNFDLSSLYTAEAYGAVYEAALDVTGLPEADTDDLKALLNKQRIIEAAILAASLPIQKSRIKRGFLVQLQLVPQETVMLLYGRDKPVMTTRWMRMDDAAEVNLIVNKARQLLDALAKNSWDTRSIKLSFRYDREVATRNR